MNRYVAPITIHQKGVAPQENSFCNLLLDKGLAIIRLSVVAFVGALVMICWSVKYLESANCSTSAKKYCRSSATTKIILDKYGHIHLRCSYRGEFAWREREKPGWRVTSSRASKGSAFG